MKKFNTSPISGMQELLPTLQTEFNRLKNGFAEVFAMHGFLNIETPTIERTAVLLAKAGGDTEKQIYKVIKTAETSAEADQALRFDHTVPLARYTVEHLNDLVFPFKATQIGRNFRGERPQKGRFREFYQCDVDVIGRNQLALAYDAEIIATLAEAIRLLPLPSFLVRVSNRKLLSGLLQELNLEHQSAAIFDIVDHAEKVPAETTEGALTELGIGSENVVKITTFIDLAGPRAEVVAKLEGFGFANVTFQEGIRELSEVLGLLEQAYPDLPVQADLKIVRGLDYYTGTVFETIVPEYREIGSICSGGRYENLASHYTDQALPGVGGSIGLTRLFFILNNYGLIQTATHKPVDLCLIPVSKQEEAATLALAQDLRRPDYYVDVALSDRKMGDKMKYASQTANFVAVIGEDELQTRTYRLRDMTSGTEEVRKFPD